MIKPDMFVLFGSTGDLAKKKLIPALYKLYVNGVIGKNNPIVCTGRRDFDKEKYLKFIQPEKNIKNFDKKELKEFYKLIEYHRVDIENQDFCELENYLEKVDKKCRCKGNMTFYLATSSHLFEKITFWLKKCGLLKKISNKKIVYEKPFGQDSKSAERINKNIRKIFKEKEIFRIDHYIGKELVQNIITLRFANSLFEKTWNKSFIDNVQIIVSEKSGVGTRAGYYDNAGATRDMAQNHLLQILSFTAMNHPKSLSAIDLQREKVKVLKKLKKAKLSDFVAGQYKGYKQEKNVNPNSKIETFVAIKTFVDDSKFKGVPFYLMTGKNLAKSYAEVNIVLKDASCHLFYKKGQPQEKMVISIRIQPDEGISLKFNAKHPLQKGVTPVVMEFCHACEFGMATPQAYEKLLSELLIGDKTLFTSWQEVRTSWKFVDTIIEYMDIGHKKIVSYDKGVDIPKFAKEFIKKDGREWIHAKIKS